MRRWLTLLVILHVWSGCTRDAGTTGDMVLRRVIRLGSAPEAEAGAVYWGARTWVSDDQRKRLIFDLDAKTVTFVDKGAQTYIVRTLDEVVRKYGQRPARRAGTAQVVLARTDETERIAGYDARRYTFAGQTARGSVWVSDALRPPPAWHEWEGLIAYLEGGFAGGAEVSDAVTELGGYPLRTAVTFGEGAGAWTITTQVAEIVPGVPTEDLIRIPDGFQRANDFPIPTG